MLNKKTIILLVFVIIIVWSGYIVVKNSKITNVTGSTMNLSSPAFDNGGVIPSIYTCRGAGDHPPLEIGGVPEKATSLALIVDDPDAVTRPEFVHWVVWNMTSDIREIGDNLPAEAIEGENSIGDIGYFAPCPPSGTHHYQFKLYALDKKLELVETANKLELEKVMAGHIIDQTELVGLVRAN